MTGIAVFAHGSSVESANEAVRAAAAEMAAQGGFVLVEAGFLELGMPDLPGAVERLVSRGATRIIVVPYFLTLGIHLQRDLPRIIDGIRNIHKSVRIEVSKPLDGHPALIDALRDRATELMKGGDDSESQAD
jgi:sirohydrochlorin ferrochelatase